MLSSYTGRFAPSPTGPLHFGSVVAALGSYLVARQAGGRWLVRIDDLDPPREVAGAAAAILRCLEALGLEWDGEVVYQSARHAAYADALTQLEADGHLFACACTRREAGPGPYPGTCRDGLPPGRAPRALRVRVDGRRLGFNDRLQGRIAGSLAETSGDFIVRRADGLIAYHLAVVVDDAAAGITEVVRGVDLIDSTPQQIWLQQLLGLPTPAYLHLPVALNEHGTKLSKQTAAPSIDETAAPAALRDALVFLGCELPPALAGAPPRELLAFARANWRLADCEPLSRAYRPSASANIERSSS